MQKTIHRSDSRGLAEHGWLTSRHTFSFAGYNDPQRIRFGLLRVLNDDIIQGGKGFGTHPHDNMEILSIGLKGALEHQDSMGNKAVISMNEVQIMSAGKGIRHSEYNHSLTEDCNFLQLWIFPQVRDIEPRYEQARFDLRKHQNHLILMVSPDRSGETLWINQQSWISMGTFQEGNAFTYTMHKPGNGVYLFLIEGEMKVGEDVLNRRDGLGIWDTGQVEIESRADSQLLVIEVPMN